MRIFVWLLNQTKKIMKYPVFIIPVLLFFTLSIFSQSTTHDHRCADGKEYIAKNIVKGLNEPTANQQNYDVHYYNIDITFDHAGRSISGYVDIAGTVIHETIDHIEIDLTDVLTVDSVVMNGQSLSFSHSGLLLTVDFGQTLSVGDPFSLRVYYGGVPENLGYLSFSSHNGQSLIWSISDPWGARTWWPCKDYPYDKADSVDIRFTVPSEMIVASNGKLMETIASGENTTYWWHEGYPITTYLVSIAAYPYTTFADSYDYGGVEPMPVEFYVFPENYDAVQTNYAKTVAMIDTFSNIFGQYPFIDEKYGHAEYGGWASGMEHQTIASLSAHEEYLIAHELSHQWWGDMLSCASFHHIWLNEGFANYAEALWGEARYGFETYKSIMNGNRYLGSGTVYVENPEEDEIFSWNLSYQKASWVVHMLRHVVGDENFFDILQMWASGSHAYDVVTTDDFKHLCEQVSGMDLTFFFEEWIYGEYYPDYNFNWTVATVSGQYHLAVDIEQIQTHQLFTMPVDITVTTASGDRTFVVRDSLQGQSFDFTLDEEPIDVKLDPDSWILRKVHDGNRDIVGTHDVGNCRLTISSLGSIGFNKPGELGVGFVCPKDGENCLRFGSLLVGNQHDEVIDSPMDGSKSDWEVSINPSGWVKFGNPQLSDQDSRARFTGNNKKIRVTQRSYAWADEDNDDFVIMNYEITNKDNQVLSDLYVGQLLDFDKGDYAHNHVALDTARKLIYLWDEDGYVGVELLSESRVSNLTPVDNTTWIADGLTEQEKYDLISGDFHLEEYSGAANYSCVGAYGPFDIASNASVELAFAIIGGTDLEDFLHNAAMAQTKYELSVAIPEITTTEAKELEIFPNPASGEVVIHGILPSRADATCRYELFDVKGQKIKTYRWEEENIKIDTRDLVPGLYFIRGISGATVISYGKFVVNKK